MSRPAYGVYGQRNDGLENGFWMTSYQATDMKSAEYGADTCRTAWKNYTFQVRELAEK